MVTTALATPMPSASVTIAMAEDPGLLSSSRPRIGHRV